jgi:D-tyrosyl-tRNA(Tyr) deacylase
MRVVAQRVTSASVKVDGVTIGRIAQGLVLFVGIGRQDTADDDSEQIEHNDRLTSPGAHTTAAIPGAARAITLASKVAHLMIFPDAKGKSNLSLLDVKGSAS